ncbi:MAG: DUF1465 family protein [Caulobacterales bacterium]|nr:DUF1465 family protein [Caulobacterales bacterium]
MSSELFAITPADFAASDLFERTFTEGMDLVEETAAYLEGPGRKAAKRLSRSGALAYAGESMRLTTRLMQIASWLLVHRAVREGEMTPADACEERYRLSERGAEEALSLEGRGELPSALVALVTRANHLYRRVARLDARLFGEEPEEPTEANPVGRQIDQLRDALRRF